MRDHGRKTAASLRHCRALSAVAWALFLLHAVCFFRPPCHSSFVMGRMTAGRGYQWTRDATPLHRLIATFFFIIYHLSQKAPHQLDRLIRAPHSAFCKSLATTWHWHTIHRIWLSSPILRSATVALCSEPCLWLTLPCDEALLGAALGCPSRSIGMPNAWETLPHPSRQRVGEVQDQTGTLLRGLHGATLVHGTLDPSPLSPLFS